MSNAQNVVVSFLKNYGWAISIGLWVLLGALMINSLPTEDMTYIHALLVVSYGVATTFGLIGFMFGLRAGEEETHLQTIASWLTKLLIGAGLVQLQTIAESTWNLAMNLSDKVEMTAYICVFTLVASASIGIIFGYLWSQLHYGSLKEQSTAAQ